MKQRIKNLQNSIWPKAKQRKKNVKRALGVEFGEIHQSTKAQAQLAAHQPKAAGGRCHPGAAAPRGRPTLGSVPLNTACR